MLGLASCHGRHFERRVGDALGLCDSMVGWGALIALRNKRREDLDSAARPQHFGVFCYATELAVLLPEGEAWPGSQVGGLSTDRAPNTPLRELRFQPAETAQLQHGNCS